MEKDLHHPPPASAGPCSNPSEPLLDDVLPPTGPARQTLSGRRANVCTGGHQAISVTTTGPHQHSPHV